jgi:hypothetical protein
MERIKSNKYALILFIATIVMLVLGVINIIVTIAGMETALEVARTEAAKTGATPDEVNLAVAITRGALYAAIVISAILLVFEVLCGLKCSMHGKWRIGAIVFGVLLCLDYVWAITRGGWMNWISALIAGFYLVGAIMCKPDAPKAEVTE